jgi:AcrR family transcriptional regulator
MATGQTRRYHSPHRTAQAAQTRQAILDAATALFNQKGWAATTIADIAAAAGVALETVYARFGSKANLLERALDVAIVGDQRAVPLAARAEFERLGTGTHRDRVEATAALLLNMNRRTARLGRTFQEAAASIPEVAVRWRDLERRRYETTTDAIRLIIDRDPEPDEIATVWVLASADTYLLLADHRRWSDKTYQRWLTVALDTVLHDMPSGPRARDSS